MKPLNNGGWGVVTFIIILSMLLIALLLVAYFSNQFEKEFPRDVDYSSPVITGIEA